MPTCQHTMSVTVSGPLTSGPDRRRPRRTSSHQRGSAPRGRSAAYWASMAAISLVGVGGQLDVVVLLALARLGALGADHQPVLRRQQRAVDRPGTPGRTTRAPPARRTRSACRARRPARCGGPTRPAGPQRRPPLAGAGRSRRRGRPAGGRPSSGPGGVGDLGDLVLADERVAPDERRRGDRTSPARAVAVAGSHHSGLSSP